MPSRRDGIPFLVDPQGQSRPLSRVPLNERKISEGWLQNLVFENPRILPIEDIDPSFGPLIGAGLEIGTRVGPIDAIFVSPTGALTIVEAKLWKNHEARREVVGQIIDYAKELKDWNFDDLDAQARERTGKSLWQLASQNAEAGLGGDEAAFRDGVSRNLQSGRFLLLIVGDGIREEVERMAEFLQETPHLHFTLALIELQLYQSDDDGSLLVLPLVVARTQEVIRAVIKIDPHAARQVQVSVDVSEPRAGHGRTAKEKLSEEEFFNGLASKGMSAEAIAFVRRIYNDYSGDDRFAITWGTSSFGVKLRDPIRRSRLLSVMNIELSKKMSIWSLANQLKASGRSEDIAFRFAADTAKLLGWEVADWSKDCTSGPINDLQPRYEAFKEQVERLVQEIYAASAAGA